MFGGGYGGPRGYGGPMLTRHARRLQMLAGAQCVNSVIIFLLGIALFAIIEDSYEQSKRNNMWMWSSGLPYNTLMPIACGIMGMITGYLGWWSIRTRRDVKSEALKHGYHILGIFQILFFDFGMVYYGLLFISETATTGWGNDFYTKAAGTSLPDAEVGMCVVAGILAFLSLINIFLFFVSSAINCMCCDPFIDRFPQDMGYNYRPRPMYGPPGMMGPPPPPMSAGRGYGVPELRY